MSKIGVSLDTLEDGHAKTIRKLAVSAVNLCIDRIQPMLGETDPAERPSVGFVYSQVLFGRDVGVCRQERVNMEIYQHRGSARKLTMAMQILKVDHVQL